MGPTRAQPASLGPEEFAPTAPSPRAVVVASLADTLSRAVALGDEDAAWIVHETIGRLLGLEPAVDELDASGAAPRCSREQRVKEWIGEDAVRVVPVQRGDREGPARARP